MTRLTSTGRSVLSYPDRGATRFRPLPEGYHHLHYRARVGHGRAAFEAAGAAVSSFRMHRATGASVRADGPAVPGARVEIGLGVGPLRITVPCEVIWTPDSPGRLAGFAYGTLAGHPESGEESFLVELAADGTVWFEVTAFSRPAVWYTRLAGPLVPVLQRAYARLLGRRLRALAAAV
ncbi:uncharacterized protein (UPF0548 family) [Streptomyces sp. 3211.6]|uniref:DUF1990 family protein n=1 Tax=Streptomyces TaxID=1883 RepID=UPI0009A55527|nr:MULTISPECIES: DUF1990 domain-containing protein [Streptomyces]RKT08083.1 uncharacterized protein (UPF0548 family) [Streptomyces sp. 3211.6]RPF44288.1 uncharacterized protein (UPF0548 family) [Streptomyces sp. Ag109_G2-6]